MYSTKLLSNGEHDGLWRDVMGEQVPNGVAYLKAMANDNRKRLLLEIVKEQYELGDISKDEYSNTLKRLRDDISKRG